MNLVFLGSAGSLGSNLHEVYLVQVKQCPLLAASVVAVASDCCQFGTNRSYSETLSPRQTKARGWNDGWG